MLILCKLQGLALFPLLTTSRSRLKNHLRYCYAEILVLVLKLPLIFGLLLSAFCLL
jgi:hypothetical protein